jgi:hypothetical protein
MPTKSTNETQPNKVLCILGMHRSGTSYLTGSLQETGLELGTHHTWNRHNQKGNRENQSIVDLHEEIFASNNGSWDSLPKRTRWSAEHIETAKSILNENSTSEIWGFKDPRALIFLEQWKALIDNIQFIGIFRHPVAVAKSLNKRGKIPIETGIELWYRYNKKLMNEYKKNNFPLLCFDWSEEILHSKLNQAAIELNLGAISEEDIFYSSKLRHHNISSTDELPWKVRRLYNKLQKNSY